MPPAPRFFSSTPPPSLLYSKDKLQNFQPTPFSHRFYAFLIISIILFVVGLGGIIFTVANLRRPPRNFAVFRCDRDSLTTYRSEVLGEEGLTARSKVLGFVGIQTGFSSHGRRTALRSTWFPATPEDLISLEQSTGLAFRFVIGRTKDEQKIAILKEEEEKYHDFMFIDIEDEYAKLPYKTLAFFKYAFNLFDAEFYVKADDDIYLRPDRLATLLAKDRAHRRTYIGCMKKGPVITNPKFKWYESSSRLLGNEYFVHAYGPMYALSAEVVAFLAEARSDSLRMFDNEDVTIGSWMLAMNVDHEDNRAICEPKCTTRSIAIWDIPRCSGLCNPEYRLKELHNISMCSQSLTLPSEEDMQIS